jgi:Ca-activated chloride channel family protein
MSRQIRYVIIAVSCILVAGNTLFSQETRILARTANRGRTEPASIRVDSRLVLIPVNVRDASNHAITDLSWRSFRIFEDNVEQRISSFSRQDGPASIGFIVDMSRSMQLRIDRSLAAVESILNTRADGDEWFLMRFADTPTMVTRFTQDPNEIRSALSSVRCDGWTGLNDAVYLGLNEMKRAKNARKALVVLTDGADNRSRYTDSEVLRFVRESDVRIYSIGLFGRVDFLDKIGNESGGGALWTRQLADVPAIVEELSRAFRNEYVLGYAPKNHSDDRKYRQVVVKLADTRGRERLKLSWRRAYYSGW